MIFMVVNGRGTQVKIKDKFGNEISMKNMWGAYGDYKDLFEFYQSQKNLKITAQEMRDRVEYILKHGCNQRTEIETLCWILGEDLVGNKKTN